MLFHHSESVFCPITELIHATSQFTPIVERRATKRGDVSEQGHHCPFLNRADSRCGEHLQIGQLDHAFEYCFDVYAACPVYLDLLIERRTKSADRLAEPAEAKSPADQRVRTPHVSGIVQVQVRRRALAYRNA